MTKREVIGVSIGVALVVVGFLSTTLSNEAYASSKGLKVFLTIENSQPSQNGRVAIFQDGNLMTSNEYFINSGRSELTLQYPSGWIDTGSFEICIRLSDGAEGCGDGYNSPEKKPEYVTVYIGQLDTSGLIDIPNQGNDQSQSQSQGSSNVNENSNALSQSQETKIYICNDKGCTVQ